MPKEGFATIAIKPTTNEKLQKITDQIHSMFIPSTLIMLMNEIKNKEYDVHQHNQSSDLRGNYIAITIRDDVIEWFEEKFEEFGEEYESKYEIKKFTKFVNYFILNMIESRIDFQNQSIHLNTSNFVWFQNKYQKQKKNLHDLTFEEFTNIYIGDLLSKIDKEKMYEAATQKTRHENIFDNVDSCITKKNG